MRERSSSLPVMLDAFTRVVSQADARGEYLSTAQLDAMSNMVAEGNKRMDAVNRITSNASTIVANAGRSLFAEQPQLIAPGGNAYTSRRLAACLRDMEIILRYITYATFTGDASVLEDRCLNGLSETYVALGVPGASVAVSVKKMKEAAIAIANDQSGITLGDCSFLMAEIASYFDRVAAAVNFVIVPKSETELTRRKPWEISNYAEWLTRDKLTQKLQQYGAKIQESAEGFFEAWERTPIPLRREVWCQRQVMAELYEQMMSRWRTIPGFRSVAIATKLIDGRKQLVGILIFQHLVSDTYYQTWNIPQYLKLESPINSLKYGEQETVPILLEWELDEIEEDKVSIPKTLETVKPPPPPTILIQSGDRIAGQDSNGCLCREGGSFVTLTTFVVPQSKGKSHEKENIRLLSVYHGFELGYKEVNTCETNPTVRIGKVDYTVLRHPEQKRKAANIDGLDVALIKLDKDRKINPFLKWVKCEEVIPKLPVFLGDGEEWDVQMYGGASGHQVGQIEHLMVADPHSGIISITALIPSKPGDSGALLVTGKDSFGYPKSKETLEKQCYSQVCIKELNFAMVGVLKKVRPIPYGDRYITRAYFTPIRDIFKVLEIRPYLERNE